MSPKPKIIAYLLALARATVHMVERGEIMKTIFLALAALAAAYLTAVMGVATPSPHIAEWAIGLVFVVLLVFYAPYRAWLDERKKVESFEAGNVPRISLDFVQGDEAYETRTTHSVHGKVIYYRVRVCGLSNLSVKGCIGYLAGIQRLKNDEWVRAPYSDLRVLHWVGGGFAPVDLDNGLPRMLDVFYLAGDNGSATMRLCDASEPRIANGEASAFRFDIAITGADRTLARKTFEVRHSGKWENALMREIATAPEQTAFV